MILTGSLHNHSTWCDGKNTPREMIEAAIAAGFTDFGISGHTYVTPDDFGVRDEEAYLKELRALQEEYRDRIRFWVGLEHDYYFPVTDRARLDYIVGSIHELRDEATGRYYLVDGPKSDLAACRDELFGGDGLAMAERFFELTVENVRTYRPDIIGHFDLIVKNNAANDLFDETSSRYREMALAALRRCADTGCVFEINTGGMFRGYRDTPYPAAFLLEELARLGARVTVSADAHETRALRFEFGPALELLKKAGFASVAVWENGRFVDKLLPKV